jgi:hypothetical protein
VEVVQPIYLAKLRRARAPWVYDLRPATLAFATLLLISAASLLYLNQASHVAATGYDITYAQDERGRLEREQQLLLVRAAELQRLARIEAEATGQLGMVPAPMPEYLRVRPAPVDVEAALKQAEREAQHLPREWRARLAAAMRLRSAEGGAEGPP